MVSTTCLRVMLSGRGWPIWVKPYSSASRSLSLGSDRGAAIGTATAGLGGTLGEDPCTDEARGTDIGQASGEETMMVEDNEMKNNLTCFLLPEKEAETTILFLLTAREELQNVQRN